MKRGFKIILVVLLLAFMAGIASLLFRQKPTLPQATNIQQLNIAETNTNSAPATEQAANIIPATPTSLPTEFNLDIPFTSQAPTANWDAVHEEFCEEASLVMANRFISGRKIDGASDADQAMNAMKDWEVEHFGYFESTTAEETATIAREYLGLQSKVVKDFTWKQVKQELIQGHVVILPTAGQELGNPNFTAPGPVYHMLVVKGWTSRYMITNDPGTRKGADYVYGPPVLYGAVGDYNQNDPAHGDTVMVVVWK